MSITSNFKVLQISYFSYDAKYLLRKKTVILNESMKQSLINTCMHKQLIGIATIIWIYCIYLLTLFFQKTCRWL